MPFGLNETTEVLCTNVNVRREKHGDENVPAIDLSFRKEGSNDLLDLMDPSIRTTLYCNRAADEGQAKLPEVLAILPNLKLPKLEQTHRWGGKDKFGGYRLVHDFGLGDERSNLELTDCIVCDFRFETKEGGTVVLDWKVQVSGEQLDPETRGRITGWTMEKMHIQLIAPPVLQLIKSGKKAVLSNGADPGDEDDDPDEQQGDERSAEDIFAQESQAA